METSPTPSLCAITSWQRAFLRNRGGVGGESVSCVHAFRFVEKQTARRAARDSADARLLALTDFAQVLFGLNEFMYVD